MEPDRVMSAIPACQHKGKFMVTPDQNTHTHALVHIYVSAADVGQMSKRLDCNIDSDQSQRAVVCGTFYVESIPKKRAKGGDRREASKQTRYKKKGSE